MTAFNSAAYWDARYSSGGHSGRGSYGRAAAFKADVLNRFVRENGIRSVVELGCGDGNQLGLADYPQYFGLDVSPAAIAMCRSRFPVDGQKVFVQIPAVGGIGSELGKFDLAISLDVVFHLVEPDVYETYMRRLFSLAEKFVAIYSSDTDIQPPGQSAHMRHHKFTDWVAHNVVRARLLERLPGLADNISSFYFYGIEPTNHG